MYELIQDLPYTVKPMKMATLKNLTKRQKIVFQDQISLNAGQKYCRMLQGEHSAKLLTAIKLLCVIKIFVLSIFEWPFYKGFTVSVYYHPLMQIRNFEKSVFVSMSNYICFVARSPSIGVPS